MNSTSPKSSLAKIGLHLKPKPFRVLILGTSGVGKTERRSPDECDEGKNHTNGKNDISNAPFRERASTDGTIFSRPRRGWNYPTHGRVSVVSHPVRTGIDSRRMSISMRGSNANASY